MNCFKNTKQIRSKTQNGLYISNGITTFADSYERIQISRKNSRQDARPEAESLRGSTDRRPEMVWKDHYSRATRGKRHQADGCRITMTGSDWRLTPCCISTTGDMH